MQTNAAAGSRDILKVCQLQIKIKQNQTKTKHNSFSSWQKNMNDKLKALPHLWYQVDDLC